MYGSVNLPANPHRRLRQVHVQCSQQQIDVVDPQIYTQRNHLQTLDAHLTQHTTNVIISS